MAKKTPGAKAGKLANTQPQPPANAHTANTSSGDLPDTPRDEEKLQDEEATLDLPEVKDIPGQEYVQVPRMNAFPDTTVSSEDEEGASVLDNPVDEDIVADRGSNVSAEEASLLQDAAEYTSDEEDRVIRATALDSTDEEGDPLNESGFSKSYSGKDLDVPGSEDDDYNEEIGEEDEENNAYSVDEENEDDEKE